MTAATRRSILRDSVETHTANVLALAHPTPVVRLDLTAARGCVLAEDILSPLDLPPFDNAAMDGYALRAQDIPAGGGVLPVRGDIPAGPRAPTCLAPGTAQRIMTGAPVPDGADTVVQVEWTDAGTETMTVRRCPPRGANIRREAHELRRGDLTLRGGTELTPARLAMLAAVGIPDVPVHRRPRVAVLATGSELVSPGAPRPAGGVYDSNATMLAALLEQDGAVATELGRLPDDEDMLLGALLGAAAEHDVLITVGGISAGAYEVVRQALTPLGSMRFLSVAMSPGSPQGLGVLGTTPVLALPGNPTAALVSYLVFGRPLLRGCQGHLDPMPPWLPVALAAPLVRRPDATRFVPGLLNRGDATVLVGFADAGHRLTAFAGADRLLRVDPGERPVRAGDAVPVLVL